MTSVSERVRKWWPLRVSSSRSSTWLKISPLNVIQSEPSLVRHRLLAAGEVDDAQPRVRQAHRSVDVQPVSVGPAMREHRDHVGEPIGVDPVSVCRAIPAIPHTTDVE